MASTSRPSSSASSRRQPSSGETNEELVDECAPLNSTGGGHTGHTGHSGGTSSPRVSTRPSSTREAAHLPDPALPRLVQRVSTQERLDAILENARQRAEDLSNLASTKKPQRSISFVRMEPLLRNKSAPGAINGTTSPTTNLDVDTADETTGMIAHSRHLNYQTNTTGTATSVAASSSTARARRSAAATAAAASGTLADPQQTEPARPSSRLRQWFAQFQSIELENKGSVARDHLALERTFLAWLRTSLAFASIGIAVTQLFRLNTSPDPHNGGDGNDSGRGQLDSLRRVGVPLGTTFLGISILILFLGYHRYIESQQWVMRGKFPASRGTILLVSLVALGLMVTSLVVVIVVQPTKGT